MRAKVRVRKRIAQGELKKPLTAIYPLPIFSHLTRYDPMRLIGFIFLFSLGSCTKEQYKVAPSYSLCGLPSATGTYCGTALHNQLFVSGGYQGPNEDILFSVFNPKLTSQLTIHHDLGYNERATKIIPTSTGNLALVGTQNGLTDPTKNGLFLLLSQQGEIHTSRLLGGNYNDHLASLCELPNGHFLLVGTAEDKDQIRHGWLVEVDENGEMVKNTVLEGEDHKGFTDVLVHPSGNYVVYGYVQNVDSGERDLLLTHFTDSHTLVKEDTFSIIGYQEAHQMIGLANGDIILVGHTASVDPLHNMVGIRVSEKGQVIWQLQTGGERHDGGEAICLNNFGEIVLGGRSNSYGADKQKALIAKTTPSGKGYDQKVLDNFYDLKVDDLVPFGEHTVIIGTAKEMKDSDYDLFLSFIE